jgi:hypothetical protein
MTEKPDPLQALVVDTQRGIRETLAAILKDKVMLDLQTASVHVVRKPGATIGARQAILLALLGRKALSLLKPDAVDAISPKELAEITGVKGNTVRPLLMRLSEEGLIVRRAEGYAVLNAALHLVAGAINHSGADNK